jgi:hypothetical protein
MIVGTCQKKHNTEVGAEVNYTMYNPLHTTQVNKDGMILVERMISLLIVNP